MPMSIAIAPPANNRPMVVYLPMFDGAAAVLLNGHLVGQSGSLQDPTADMTYQPMLFALPHDLYSSTDNRLDVIVAAQIPGGGRLIPFHVGPATELESAHTTVSFLATVIACIFGSCCSCCFLLRVTSIFSGPSGRHSWPHATGYT